jgi:hypothetical protein
MLTWDDITGKVQRHIVPRLIDVVYKSSPVFTRIRTKCAERFEGGTKISQPIAYAELNGDAYKRGGQFKTEYVQTDTNQKSVWGNIRFVYNMFGNTGNAFQSI